LANDLVSTKYITQSHLLQALNERKTTVEDLTDAFIADLNQSKPKISLLILDQFDNLPISDDSNIFLNT